MLFFGKKEPKLDLVLPFFAATRDYCSPSAHCYMLQLFLNALWMKNNVFPQTNTYCKSQFLLCLQNRPWNKATSFSSTVLFIMNLKKVAPIITLFCCKKKCSCNVVANRRTTASNTYKFNEAFYLWLFFSAKMHQRKAFLKWRPASKKLVRRYALRSRIMCAMLRIVTRSHKVY